MLQDIPDNNTLYMWNCLGVNGGVNAICSAPIKDTTAPVITSLILPKTSSTLRVPLSLLVNETPVSYLMIDGPTPTN